MPLGQLVAGSPFLFQATTFGADVCNYPVFENLKLAELLLRSARAPRFLSGAAWEPSPLPDPSQVMVKLRVVVVWLEALYLREDSQKVDGPIACPLLA